MALTSYRNDGLTFEVDDSGGAAEAVVLLYRFPPTRARGAGVAPPPGPGPFTNWRCPPAALGRSRGAPDHLKKKTHSGVDSHQQSEKNQETN